MLRKRSDGQYQAIFRDRNRKETTKLLGTRNERVAKRLHDQMQAEFRHQIGIAKSEHVSLAMLRDRDIERVRRAGASEDLIMRGVGTHWKRLLEFFEPEGKPFNPARLTRENVLAYMGHRIANPSKGRSVVRSQTYKREVQALKRMVNDCAKKLGYRKPLEPEDWPTFKKDPPCPKQSGKRHRPEVIRAWLDLQSDECKDRNMFLAWSGMRAVECSRLEPCDLEHHPGSIEQPGTLHVPAYKTKIKEAHSVPLCVPAYEALTRQLARRAALENPYPTIFPKTDYRRQMERASKALGLTHNITRRDLRTTFCSESRVAGADDTALMRMVGHKDARSAVLYQKRFDEEVGHAATILYRKRREEAIEAADKKITEGSIFGGKKSSDCL